MTSVFEIAQADDWDQTRTAATKRKPAKKAPKPRKPEEVWYDVHKHPEGVPGGMGRSPEHHLRNRGWSGHEINEGSGKKTIQYRNHKHPDFVISYGGGSSTKPDHNFRVLYMGGNRNIPKVTRGHSLAEAMNKVEELQQLEGGLVVQPMTHDSAFNSDNEPREAPAWADVAHENRQQSWREWTERNPHLNLSPNHMYASPEGVVNFTAYPDRQRDKEWPAESARIYSEEDDKTGVVQPMVGMDRSSLTGDSEWGTKDKWEMKYPTEGEYPFRRGALAAPDRRKDMTVHDHFPIGAPEFEQPTEPPKQESDWVKPRKPYVKQIEHGAQPAKGLDHRTSALVLAQRDSWEY